MVFGKFRKSEFSTPSIEMECCSIATATAADDDDDDDHDGDDDEWTHFKCEF